MRKMGFDDLAKRMGGSRGGAVGDAAVARDPDQIMAEAQRAAERSSRISDLILGPLLLLGGAGILVLCFLVARQGGLMYGMAFAAIGAVIVGGKKILRGLGLIGD
jgi:hypothetical protein